MDAAKATARADERRSARRIRNAVIGAVATAVIVALAALTLTIVTTSKQSQTVASEVGQLAATGEVASARAESLDKERRDLAEVNTAMLAAGLATCPDPGPTATAYQVSSAVGECRGTLRTVGELQKRGLAAPGVNAPDPASPQFPSAGRGPLAGPGG